MKIKTITCHDVLNYGASLQAFALYRYLENSGHDVEIIDYLPSYLKPNQFRPPKSSRFYIYYHKYPIIARLRKAWKFIQMFPMRHRRQAFNRFTKSFLRLTDHYDNFRALVAASLDADLYIAGSDQIWNSNFDNGLDPAFYLLFGKSQARRIAYAASFAEPKVADGCELLVKTYLSNFDAISVRELTGVEILNDLNVSGINVLDPVFLLSAIEWKKYLLSKEKRPFSFPYLLIYDLNHINKDMSFFIKQHAQRNGWKIVAVNDKVQTLYADKNVNNAGPVEFLNLIINAEMVVADSFHATALSIIFHRPFACFYKKTNASRMKDLLAIVGLSDRLNPIDEPADIDWCIVQNKIDVEVEKSKEFLNRQIQLAQEML